MVIMLKAPHVVLPFNGYQRFMIKDNKKREKRKGSPKADAVPFK